MKRSKFSALDTIIIFLLFVGLVTAVATCTYKNATTEETPGLPSYVHRYVDEKARVVCWVYEYGIDCLPIEQTRLEQ